MGFKIITPNELILNTWDTLIVKGDDTMTEFPYDSKVEYSLKLLCPSDYSDLLPLIFFKPFDQVLVAFNDLVGVQLRREHEPSSTDTIRKRCDRSMYQEIPPRRK